VFGLTAHRTTVVAARQGPSTLLSQLQALSQAWGGALAIAFALVGGSVGAAVARVVRGLSRRFSQPGPPSRFSQGSSSLEAAPAAKLRR
jgi:hypothetical protein